MAALKNKRGKPILVTGSHRSGTSWVGRMIALHEDVGFIWEPFNPTSRPGISCGPFHRWFLYIDERNAADYLHSLCDTGAFKYHYRAELAALRSLKDAARFLRSQAMFIYHRCHGSRPLFKDPIALYSAEWLYQTFDMDVIVMIRHPAAFVNSIIQNNYVFGFQELAQQPMLLERYLSPYADQILEYTRRPRPILQQAILLWNIFHHVILNHYQPKHPDWLFVKHEALSLDPQKGFDRIYRHLHLRLDVRLRKKILGFSETEASDDYTVDEIRRNSRANLKSWKKQLDSGQVSVIRDSTAELAERFYNADSW